MSDKKYKKEDCLLLLNEKYKELQLMGLDRYPKRSDFSEREVVAIKAFLGPWPRALEAASIKPVRDDDRQNKNREKRARAKHARIVALRKLQKEKKKEETLARKRIIDLALAEDFAQARIIKTDRIMFDASFRPYCEENLCGQYGINYSCPPHCGTPEQMKQKILAYKSALVVNTVWKIEDFSKKEKLKESRSLHNAAMLRLIKKLRDEGHNAIMVGASGCTLCDVCKMPLGEPCAYPDMMYSCMSAYCIHVKNLALDCNMDYDYKDGMLPFFGMIAFD